jgi:capsular exopolysaccharide synthesis family protein
MLGAGLAFLVELLNDKLRTPKEIASGLRINLLGMICHSDEDDDIKSVSNICRVISDAPYSITSELYRQIRTNLRKAMDKQGDKVLLVTSVAGSDGKTTTASNLAVALAAEGKKVAFIDANFRRPSSVMNFPKGASDMPGMTRQTVGLSDYLRGDTELSEIVRQCSDTNVNVVDCGAMPVHPSEMLDDDKMDELLKQFSVSYDYVIIDGPPMIVADSKVLAIKTDACLLVFNAATTRKGAAQRVIRELNEIGTNVVGCTLVGVKSMKGGYFDEMFRRYKDYQKVKIAGVIS